MRYIQRAVYEALLVGRVFAGTLVLTCFLIPVCSMGAAVGISESNHTGVLLSFKVERKAYGKKDDLVIKFWVSNKQKKDIYLVVGEPIALGYNEQPKELVAAIHKTVLTYHSFTYPALEKIKPGKSYQGETKLPLEFLGQKFSTGKWNLFLSIGYLNAKDMSEVSDLRKRFGPDGLAMEFEKRQELVDAGPIGVELIE